MTQRLSIVTGSSSGLGAALTDCLLERGWLVHGLARRPVERSSPNYHHECLDLSDPDAVRAHFQQKLPKLFDWQDLQRVALINNAASLGPVGPLQSLDFSELQRAMTLNALVPAWLMAHFVQICDRQPLRIVNISSGAATKAYAGWSSYCMGKAAQLMAGQALAADIEEMPQLQPPRDVCIVDFAPGVVDTPMQNQVRAFGVESLPRVERFRELHAKGELVPPEAPAKAIAELLDRDDLPRFHATRFGA